MYARSTLCLRSVHTLDLPVFPFLAPRVFQPWPKKGQNRRTAATATAEQGDARVYILEQDTISLGRPKNDKRATDRSEYSRTKPIDLNIDSNHGPEPQSRAVHVQHTKSATAKYTSKHAKDVNETQSQDTSTSITSQSMSNKIRSKEVEELRRIVHLLNKAGDTEAALELQAIIGKDDDLVEQTSYTKDSGRHDRTFKEVYNTTWDAERTSEHRFSEKDYAKQSQPLFNMHGSDGLEFGLDNVQQAQSLPSTGPFKLQNQNVEGLNRRQKRFRFMATSYSPRQQSYPAQQPLVPSRDSLETFVSGLWSFGVARRNPSKYDQSFTTGTKSQRTDAEQNFLNETHALARRLAQLGSSAEVRSMWKNHCLTAHSEHHNSSTSHHLIWLGVMLSVFRSDIDSALKVLVATSDTPNIPTYALGDALERIIRHYTQSISENVYKSLKIVRDELAGMFELGVCKPIFTQTSVYYLLKHCRPCEVKSFFDILSSHDVFLHPNTLLHFVSALAEAGESKAALDILSVLHDHGTDFASPIVESACATLLRGKFGRSQPKVSDLEIFESMLKYGLKPNIIFYNILLHNASENGSSETAWQIYGMMEDVGIEADGYTMSILLKDAKDRLDEEAVRNVELLMHEKRISNPHLITDLMHAKFLFGEEHRQHSSSQAVALSEIYALYSTHWSSEPLIKLFPDRNISHVSLDAVSASKASLPLPPLPTLAVTVGAMMHHFHRTEEASSFYHRLVNLIYDGEKLILPLAGTASFWDALIKVLGRSTKNLHLCTQILEAMLSATHANPFPLKNSNVRSQISIAEPAAGPKTPSLARPKPKLPYRMPKPTIRTWTILLKAYIDHNQPRAAEKVLSMLKARGLQPNQITWNTLATGYARLQDIPNTVSTIKRLEHAGYKLDTAGLRGLQCIQDRQALMKAMAVKRQSEPECEIESKTDGLMDRIRLSGSEEEHEHSGGMADENKDSDSIVDQDVYGKDDTKDKKRGLDSTKKRASHPVVRRVPQLARPTRRIRTAVLDPATLVMT